MDDYAGYELVTDAAEPPRLSLAPLNDDALGANDASIGALVLGIAGLMAAPIFIFSIAAIVYGVRGLAIAADLRDAGYRPSGRAISIAGVVLGSCGILTAVSFDALLAVELVRYLR
jgi:hypothetical protein